MATVSFGCFLTPTDDRRQRVVHRMVSELARRLLVQRLRVDAGASYLPAVKTTSLRGGTSVFTGQIDVDPGAVDAGLAVVRDIVAGKALTSDAAAIEAARWRLARGSGLFFQTNARLARLLFDTWNVGWPIAELDDYPTQLASVTADDLRQTLASCAASAVLSVVRPAP